MGSLLPTATLTNLALSILLGWLAGGLANWAADVLPGRGPASRAAQPRIPKRPRPYQRRAATDRSPRCTTSPCRGIPFRRGVCPHCGERRPLRAPLLEAATIVAFALAWLLIPDPGP